MQNYAKQWYIFGHLSLIWNLALDILRGVAIVRDCPKLGASKKKKDLLECFLRHLSFWVSGVELPLIFYTQK